mmetsp:Transcript_3501/g.6693  ORF Transcript_3501/g.6693 Transcript_3501/m.6693 type:complete len:346 (+) Transcript_3501:66-1103(+)
MDNVCHFVSEPDMEAECISVCGFDFFMLRRRRDYFAAVAGDLDIQATGVVLWECSLLLAEYMGYALWIHGGKTELADGDADIHPWWMTHPPAPVVPSRFWSSKGHRVLELGGGSGLVSVTLACLGASVVCSDGDPAAVMTAKRNCHAAKSRYGHGARTTWGSVDFQQLRWGDKAAVRQLVREHGPFGFVVGSDLLYGDSSPAGPLLETLAAIATEPEGSGAEVILAMKNRCRDEAYAFCSLARERGLWSVRTVSQDDLPGQFSMTGQTSDDCPAQDIQAYHVIHMTVLKAHGQNGAKLQKEEKAAPCSGTGEGRPAPQTAGLTSPTTSGEALSTSEDSGKRLRLC